ncbi:MAG: Rnase Y domain-containing protein, partial [Thermodesulfobacteriota bacterium]|nr:Rnase Y domain-containing protein [Thermodesulfobacteriota bacterium]
MTAIYTIGIILLGLVAGIPAGFFVRKKFVESRTDSIEKYSEKILAEAQKEAKATKKEAAFQAKDILYQMKVEFERETKEKKEQLVIQERRLFHKEESLDRKTAQIEKREGRTAEREKSIDQIEKDLKKKQADCERIIADQTRQLEDMAGMSSEEAKQVLIDSMESEAKHDAAKLMRKIENEAKGKAGRKAQEILALAVRRYAGDYVAEKTVSVVNLPNEDMKGRIIGREGRNIRAIEAATGVDLIIDDTPEAVILS